MPERTTALQLSIRAAVAAALGVGLAKLLRLEFPVYALISAVLVTDLDPKQTQRKGLSRLAGTIVGASLGAIISGFLGPSPLEVGLGVFAAIFLTHLLRLAGAAHLSGYVCGLVLLSYGQRPWFYAVHRSLETLLGMGFAVLISFVPKLLPTPHQREVR